MPEVRHNCGIFLAHSLDELYEGLKSLKNRGREAFGIAGIGDRIDVLKAIGKIDTFSLKTLHKIFNRVYHTFIGHVRYATKGRKDPEQILQDAHPISLGGEVFKRGNHLIIRDCRLIIVHNGQINERYFEGYDLGELKTGTDTEKLLRLYDQIKEKEILKRIPGAYTAIIADRGRRDIVVMRDRTGIRPGVLGWKAGKFIVASEDSALLENQIQFREELKPGYVYYISPDGTKATSIKVVEIFPKHCFFEWNYIAKIGSTIANLQVRRLRRALGEKLAEEFMKEVSPDKIDFVSFVPECPEEAALGFAEKLGKECISVFYKVDEERSFQGPDKSDRENSIKRNLNLSPDIEKEIEGKTGVIIEDSIIRGNNAGRAQFLLQEVAKVKNLFLLSYTPQIGIIPWDKIPRGCEFGVDMPPIECPPDHEFIARNRNLQQISEKMKMSVKFLSKEGMLEVFEKLGIPRTNLCTFCIGGDHPFSGIDEEKIEDKKLDSFMET